MLNAVEESNGLIDNWEIAHNIERLQVVVEAASAAAETAGVSLYLSKLRSKDEMERGGEKYYHMINHGFTPEEGDQIDQISSLDGVEGIVFRVAGEMSPWHATRNVAHICRTNGRKASLHIRMSVGSPAEIQADEAWAANRLAEALLAAAAYKNVHVYADTFADVDRGYFLRQGVVDRLYNPRLAFHVLRHLIGALASDTGSSVFTPGDDDMFPSVKNNRDRQFYLISSENRGTVESGPGQAIDLLSGQRTQRDVARSEHISPPDSAPVCLWAPDD